MDHAVRTSKTKPWDKLRFENEELECLYQRYTLKMQRFSVIGVVSLFVIFCMTMMTLSYVFSSLLTLHVRTQYYFILFHSILYMYIAWLCYVHFGSVWFGCVGLSWIELGWVELFFSLRLVILCSQRIAIAQLTASQQKGDK